MLTLTGNRKRGRERRYLYEYSCHCGNITWVYPYSVKSGNTTSCGCALGWPKGKNRKEDIKYRAAHKRLGSVQGYRCGHCGFAACEWAYTGEDPDVRYSNEGYPYSLDSIYYIPLCKSCHVKFDKGEKQYGSLY